MELSNTITTNNTISKKPKPFRLIMISIINNCQFCCNPKGEVYFHYVSFLGKFGFVSCACCCELADAAVKEWNNTEAYGRARKLINMPIKIRRSSGTIEEGWMLNMLETRTILIDENECVNCVNKEKNISKWICINELLSLNENIT